MAKKTYEGIVWDGWKPSAEAARVVAEQVARIRKAYAGREVSADVFVGRPNLGNPAIAFLHLYLDGEASGLFDGPRIMADELPGRTVRGHDEYRGTLVEMRQYGTAGECVKELVRLLPAHADKLIAVRRDVMIARGIEVYP